VSLVSRSLLAGLLLVCCCPLAGSLLTAATNQQGNSKETAWKQLDDCQSDIHA